MAYLYHQRLMAVLLFLLVTCSDLTSGSPVYDMLYLNLTKLQSINSTGLNVPIPSSVTLICQDATVQVYNVDKVQYDNCQQLTNSNIQIGHCAKSPLSLNVHGVTIPGSVNYEVGKTYYYAIYDNDKGTGPCETGYKFMINVYDPNAITSTSPISEPSSTILIEPSSTMPIPETTTFSNVRLTSHLPPLRPTTINSNKPTVLPKPSEEPKEPIESPKRTNNPRIDPRITSSSPIETIDPSLDGIRSGTQTLRVSTMLFICTAFAIMLILPLRRLL